MPQGHAIQAEVICEKQGHAGLIHLNRPKALNALTHEMVKEIAIALDQWEQDPEITRILIDAEGSDYDLIPLIFGDGFYIDPDL